MRLFILVILKRCRKVKLEIKEFDRVLLKDGREGDVMEIYGDQDQFEITLGEKENWYDETVSYKDIDRVIHTSGNN